MINETNLRRRIDGLPQVKPYSWKSRSRFLCLQKCHTPHRNYKGSDLVDELFSLCCQLDLKMCRQLSGKKQMYPLTSKQSLAMAMSQVSLTKSWQFPQYSWNMDDNPYLVVTSLKVAALPSTCIILSINPAWPSSSSIFNTLAGCPSCFLKI